MTVHTPQYTIASHGRNDRTGNNASAYNKTKTHRTDNTWTARTTTLHDNKHTNDIMTGIATANNAGPNAKAKRKCITSRAHRADREPASATTPMLTARAPQAARAMQHSQNEL